MTARDHVARLELVLDAEERCYAEIRDVLQRERACMVDRDAAGLEEAVREKEALAEEARLVAESRIEVAAALAHELGVDDPQPTLGALCAALGADDEALRERHARLSALLAAVQELSHANASFARQGIDQVRATLRTLGRITAGEPIYGRDGASQAMPQSGRLVRRVA